MTAHGYQRVEREKAIVSGCIWLRENRNVSVDHIGRFRCNPFENTYLGYGKYPTSPQVF